MKRLTGAIFAGHARRCELSRLRASSRDQPVEGFGRRRILEVPHPECVEHPEEAWRGQARERHLLPGCSPSAHPAGLPVSSTRLDVLTPREREVVALVATGMSNGEIAERLYVPPLTAKTHVNRAMMKPGARDRAQLVVIAYQAGLVRPPGS